MFKTMQAFLKHAAVADDPFKNPSVFMTAWRRWQDAASAALMQEPLMLTLLERAGLRQDFEEGLIPIDQAAAAIATELSKIELFDSPSGPSH